MEEQHIEVSPLAVYNGTFLQTLCQAKKGQAFWEYRLGVEQKTWHNLFSEQSHDDPNSKKSKTQRVVLIARKQKNSTSLQYLPISKINARSYFLIGIDTS